MVADTRFLDFGIKPGSYRPVKAQSDIRNPTERKIAKQVMSNVSNGRFSPQAFAKFLYIESACDEEVNDMISTCIYFLGMVAEEASTDFPNLTENEEAQNRGYMAMRILDNLAHFGYIK